jgi:hypothetical protein
MPKAKQLDVKPENIIRVAPKGKNTITGWCANGGHEGKKARYSNGAPMPTCTAINWCQCKCHAEIDEMFEETGRERTILDNPIYVPKPSTFHLEDYIKPEPAAVDTDALPVATSQAPGVLPPVVPKTFTPPPSGKAAKGELEDRVREVTDLWVAQFASTGFECTPKWISERIASKYRIKPPSVGAIGAVFDRWTRYGFAVIERKPVRFSGYTEEGIRLGLDALKAKAQRSAKYSHNADIRTGRA